MSKFMIAYYAGSQLNSKEEGMAQKNKWKAWVDELSGSVDNGESICVSNLMKLKVKHFEFLPVISLVKINPRKKLP